MGHARRGAVVAGPLLQALLELDAACSDVAAGRLALAGGRVQKRSLTRSNPLVKPFLSVVVTMYWLPVIHMRVLACCART